MKKKDSIIHIIFWGPIGHDKAFIGGGESGNKRTIEYIKKNGFHVKPIPKPYPPKSGLLKAFRYAFHLTASVCSLALACNKAPDGRRLVHVSAFYKHLIYFEFLMLITAKLLRTPFIYEIRGGAMISIFNQSSFLYKVIFTFILKCSDTILVQGMEYHHFVRKRTSADIVYYPNYVGNAILSLNSGQHNRPSEKINLIYFGRFTLDKGIEKTIHACNELISTFLLDCHLHLIGKGDPETNKRLKNLIKKLKLKNNVTIHPPMPQEKLNQIIVQMHFFIFPTYNDMEGHSNALTEAMALGVVPVCSRHGFNESVVGSSGFILDPFATPKDYAKIISKVWHSKAWRQLSQECIQKISKSFNADLIIGRLIRQYFKILH